MRRLPAVGALALALLLATAPLQAQRPTVWLKGGPTFASAGGDDADLFDTRTGFSIGLGAASARGGFGLQTELLYTRRGASIEGTGGGRADLRTDFLELPFLLLAQGGLERGLRAKVYAGPYGALRLTCRGSLTGGGGSISGDCADDTVRNVDYGAMFGGGIELSPRGRGLLSLEVRYALGLRSLSPTDGVDIRNRTWYLLVGVGR